METNVTNQEMGWQVQVNLSLCSIVGRESQSRSGFQTRENSQWDLVAKDYTLEIVFWE